ncbi:hypothetical protein JCGZ_19955 [Jatropha curcas]|uniref:Uncharacterized protein n=1 Tax=Jatropha curcas TaxID=180498 RepID=A0A067JTI5_JATCU|nr:phenolic glucoside malonyltransferase 1 [Jatropha curcas]KDP27256.1 hypothetical protein JCGZ_19955 [Jatropha curcas]
MGSPNSSSLKILYVCQVAPATDLPPSTTTRLTLPLTFFDARFFRFPPAERVYFYKLAESPLFFQSEILPTIKLSLSQTLLHFLPLAGHLTWPSDSSKPVIVYTPNDVVLLTVSESSADFDRLTSNEILEVAEPRQYIPELIISETMASIIALQITLFSNRGFSIGIAMNHSVVDGKTASMFLKAWAHICKTKSISLLPELTPSFDRSAIKDPNELEQFYLNQWKNIDSESNRRSVKLLPHLLGVSPNLSRATFNLTRERIEKLREIVFSYHKNQVTESKPTKNLHLSTVVVICAYLSVCAVKARGGDTNRKVYILVPVDCRSRLNPPIPSNYFGNCLYVLNTVAEARIFMEENGVAIIAEKLSDSIQGLETGKALFKEEKERHGRMRGEGAAVQKVGITGSPLFKYYEEDFGWGRPEKVEIVSIDRVNGVSLMDSRDGNGGVEIGMVLPRLEMESFASLFLQRLN